MKSWSSALAIACVCALWLGGSASAEPGGVNACIFTDGTSLATASGIVELLGPLSRDLRDKTGIRVEFVPVGRFYGAVNPLAPSAQHAALVLQCPAGCGIRVIFTNRARLTDNGVRLSGESHPGYRYIIVYGVDQASRRTDAGGNRQILTTLKHEIGHLVGLDHSTDPSSFMFREPDLSQGRWTQPVLEEFRARGQRLIWPEEPQPARSRDSWPPIAGYR